MSRQEFLCPEEDRVIQAPRLVFLPHHVSLYGSQKTLVGCGTSILYPSPYPLPLSPSFIPSLSSNGVSLLRPVLRLPGASYTENHLKDVWAATFMVTLYIQGPKESSNDGPVDVLIGW